MLRVWDRAIEFPSLSISLPLHHVLSVFSENGNRVRGGCQLPSIDRSRVKAFRYKGQMLVSPTPPTHKGPTLSSLPPSLPPTHWLPSSPLIFYISLALSHSSFLQSFLTTCLSLCTFLSFIVLSVRLIIFLLCLYASVSVFASVHLFSPFGQWRAEGLWCPGPTRFLYDHKSRNFLLPIHLQKFLTTFL